MESASSNIVAYKAAGIEVAANSEFLFKSGDASSKLLMGAWSSVVFTL